MRGHRRLLCKQIPIEKIAKDLIEPSEQEEKHIDECPNCYDRIEEIREEITDNDTENTIGGKSNDNQY